MPIRRQILTKLSYIRTSRRSSAAGIRPFDPDVV
jgi:hypothetical protein